MSICPPTRSVIAGALPLYATCTILAFAMPLNISPVKWATLAMPCDA